jgi:hypothetical protein
MLRCATPDAGRGLAPATAAGHADEDIYDRHAGNVYRQALFTLDDAGMAEQVVSDVIVAECVRPGAVLCGQDAEGRLAVSAYRRCMELAGGQPSLLAASGTVDYTGCAGPGGLTVREHGALGLVFFGGAGYRQAGVDLGICAAAVAALLRAALGDAAAAGPGSLPYAGQELVPIRRRTARQRRPAPRCPAGCAGREVRLGEPAH